VQPLVAKRGPARAAWARRILRAGFALVLLVFVVMVPLAWAVLWWFGLPAVWTSQLTQALSGEDYRVHIERLWLHPLDGPVAEGVRVVTTDGQTLVDLNRLVVALNWSELLQRRVQVEAVDLVRAQLRLPVSADLTLEIEEVNARLLLPPGQLRIVNASGRWGVVALQISGHLRDPFDGWGAWQASGDEEKTGTPLWQTILQELMEVEAPEPLRIELTLSGAGQDWEQLMVTGRWEGSDLRWRDVIVRHASGEISLVEGLLQLNEFVLSDDGGELVISGQYDHQAEEGTVFLRSSLHPVPWLVAAGMGQPLEEVTLSSPPLLNVRGRLHGRGEEEGREEASGWEERVVVTGSGSLENFVVREVPVDLFSLDFAWKPGVFLSRGARVETPFLSAKIDARVAEQMVSVRAAGSVDPTQCLPWLDDGMRKIFSEMEFAERGEAEVELEIPLADSGAVRGTGTLALGRTAMRGAWIDGGTSRVELGNRAVRYEDMDMRLGSLRGTGVFVYDFGQREVRLENIQSNLPPDLVLQWIDPRIAQAIEAYRFVKPPQVQASGVVDMADPLRTKLDIGVRAPEGLIYELLGKNLTPEQVRAEVLVRGRRLLVNVQDGRLFDGGVKLQADVSLDEKDPTYRLEATAERWDFAAVNQLYFNYSGSEGRMSGSLAYEAPLQNQTMLRGGGTLRVEDGNVFAIPVLGPLSGIINTILPGAGYQKARLATADFTIGDQVIHTDNLEIIGNGFSLYGEGDIRFVADELDMRVRLNAQGVPGLFLLPVSKFFEYESVGKVSEPTWRPKHLPRELTGGGVVETLTQPVRQLFGVGAPGSEGEDVVSEGEDPKTGGGPPRLRRRLR
jgi:hypothetical protein